ncbi:septum site-determining protein Ssd [Parenemella sanctibonifatiensis]|uniref:septum site-determining protein Ssd n=1 Tax=Parenemella sanctibonifatiensis TaxID=2016505 RepID=UPI0015C67D1C|nr:septum site-determining protein Ssd [Parenemella sanctibonifatiensis]
METTLSRSDTTPVTSSGPAPGPNSPVPLLVSEEDRWRDPYLAAAAAADAEVVVCGLSEVVSRWEEASTVVVGADVAEQVAALRLPSRAGVHLVGDADHPVSGWSMQLGAAVIDLPAGQPWLSQVIRGPAVGGGGSVLAVVGASGGVGVSTFVTGLGQACTDRGPTVLLDVDAAGGGLDLLLGLEAQEGWRWRDLAAARGGLSGLSGRLPSEDQLSVLAVDRDPAGAPGQVPRGALAVVLEAAANEFDAVIADLGRGEAAEHAVVLERADRILLVVATELRSIAQARTITARLGAGAVELWVRQWRPSSLAPVVVADALGLPLSGVIPHDPAVRRAADAGLPAASGAGRGWRRACRAAAAPVTALSRRGGWS